MNVCRCTKAIYVVAADRILDGGFFVAKTNNFNPMPKSLVLQGINLWKKCLIFGGIKNNAIIHEPKLTRE